MSPLNPMYFFHRKIFKIEGENDGMQTFILFSKEISNLGLLYRSMARFNRALNTLILNYFNEYVTSGLVSIKSSKWGGWHKNFILPQKNREKY